LTLLTRDIYQYWQVVPFFTCAVWIGIALGFLSETFGRLGKRPALLPYAWAALAIIMAFALNIGPNPWQFKVERLKNRLRHSHPLTSDSHFYPKFLQHIP
jgi:Na+/H+-dicarboxylate symporter